MLKMKEKHSFTSLSNSRQDVLSVNSQNSTDEQDKDLEKAKYELRTDNNMPRPRF